MLGDGTGFTGDHPGMAHRILQRGLAVVHMSEERDHRRPGTSTSGSTGLALGVGAAAGAAGLGALLISRVMP